MFVQLLNSDRFNFCWSLVSGPPSPRRMVDGYMQLNTIEWSKLTTRSTSLTSAVSGLLYMRMYQDSSCSCATEHCSVWMAFQSAFSGISVSPERGDSLEAVSPSLSLPFSFHCFISVTGACFFPPSAWGLMAGLPEFASHGSSLHLGAGCQ